MKQRQVALSERSRPQYGARREAAPRWLRRASVEGGWAPSEASRPQLGGPCYDIPRVAPPWPTSLCASPREGCASACPREAPFAAPSRATPSE
eukprot:1441059-Alexandrium_andersonii.AAC.1